MRTYEIHATEASPLPTAVMRTTLDVGEVGPWLTQVYSTVAAVLAAQGTAPAAPPFARYQILEHGRFDVEAGFPVSTSIAPEGEVFPSSLPGGSVATTTHVGPYDELESAYSALESWVSEHGGEPAGDPWESYLNDPGDDLSTALTQVSLAYRSG